MNNIKRFSAFALTVALLLSCTACGDDKDLLNSTKEELTVVKTIDGFDVPMELYRYVALNYKSDFEKGQSGDFWLGESGQEQLSLLNEMVDEHLVRMYTTLSLCDDYGIDADSKFIENTVEASMQNIYDSYDDDYKAYLEYIGEYNMNDGVYRFLVRNDILAEELVTKMIDLGEIPNDDDEFRSIFESDTFIRVKQILISSENGKTDEENLKTAEEVYAKAMAGEDFEALIAEYGGDLFMFNNPDGYYISAGSYYKEFENAAFALEIGEISDIVKTNAGYSIIKRYEKESSYINKHFDDLKENYINGQYNVALENHESTLTVENTDKLAEYSIFAMTSTSEE